MWTPTTRKQHIRKTSRYQTDVTDQEWEVITCHLPVVSAMGRPRAWPMREIINGIFKDARAADLLQEYEAKIAALERMVGRQALEIEFLKGALKSVPRPRSASTSVFTGLRHLRRRRVPPDGPAALYLLRRTAGED